MTGIEWGVALSAIAAIGWVNWYFFVAGRSAVSAPARSQFDAGSAPGAGSTGGAIAGTDAGADAADSRAGQQAAGVPEIVITVDGGYSPNAVRVKVGRPVRLVFDRKDNSSCSEEVVFPDFNIRRYLPTGERTTIEITPPVPGKYNFTCGMSMLRGSVIADA